MRKMLVAAMLFAGPAAAQIGTATDAVDLRRTPYSPCSRLITDRCIQMQDSRADEQQMQSRVPTSDRFTGTGGPYEPIEDHANAAPSDAAITSATNDDWQRSTPEAATDE